MTSDLLAFAVAAVLEIAGCFAFWLWLREDRSPFVAVAGVGRPNGVAVALYRAGTALCERAHGC